MCIQAVVQAELGNEFIKSSIFEMDAPFQESTNSTPIIFILSAGIDPLSLINEFA